MGHLDLKSWQSRNQGRFPSPNVRKSVQRDVLLCQVRFNLFQSVIDMAKVFESTVFVTFLAALVYMWGYEFLSSYYQQFGIDVDTLNLSVLAIMMKAYWPAITILSLTFLLIPKKILASDNVWKINTNITTIALVFAILIITIVSPYLGYFKGRADIVRTDTLHASFTLEANRINDFQYLIESNGLYFFYRPKAKYDDTHKYPDMIIARTEDVKSLMLY